MSGRVVHFVGRITDEVFSFLGPATLALAESGIEQTLLIVDDLHSRRLLPGLHDSIDIVLTPDGRNAVRRWAASLDAFRKAIDVKPLRAIHLHGFVPALLAPYVVRAAKARVPVFYSPHSSKALHSLSGVGQLLWWATRPLYGQRVEHAIASMPVDAQGLSKLVGREVGVIESPVDDVFFAGARHESRRPIVVTASRLDNPRSVELMAQMAVLLCDEDPPPSFSWIGKASPASMARLRAAQVEAVDLPNEIDRAIKLSAAWIYFAPGNTRGFPYCLAEALAVGLPCVAIDTPYHRDLIRHNETGFLCQTLDEILDCVARLIDSEELRVRIGSAAREEAQLRFADHIFRTSLLAAYEMTAPAPLELAREAETEPTLGGPSLREVS